VEKYGVEPYLPLGFLPEPQTDFIFSAIAEEMGFVGISALFFLFSILIWRIFKIALSNRSNFSPFFFWICHFIDFSNFRPYWIEYRSLTYYWDCPPLN